MKNKILLSFIVLLFSFQSVLTAQSKKDIKKLKIKSITTSVAEGADGKEKARTDAYTKYDNAGNVIEEAEYNKDGTLKKKITRKFNKENDVTEEDVYDGKGKTTEKTQFGYNPKGEKTFELTMDDKGKMLKKSIYTYDKNGMKTEKRTSDDKGTVISVKKYTYEY